MNCLYAVKTYITLTLAYNIAYNISTLHSQGTSLVNQ